MKLLAITLFTLVITVHAQSDYPEWINGTFPDDFDWGVATAAYQIEGGWNADYKGPNIWDTFTNSLPSPIYDQSTGNIACDSYNRYQVDVQLIKSIGADFYRFSVSWSRVIPTGRIADGINEFGIDYYNNLINELIANNIEPMVTMYHWDLPDVLEVQQGGFLNDSIGIEFEAYADLLYTRFGDRVKKWITFNEPWVVCVMGYGDGVNAPGVSLPGTAPYTCGHNLLKAHAMAYRLYERTYKEAQGGIVGITIDSGWCEPLDPSNSSHVLAAERAQQFRHGWFAYPIFHEDGDYPPTMKEFIQRKSIEDGLTTSRLPEFTDDEKQMIKGSSDFLGFNHYTTSLIEPAQLMDRSWHSDQDAHHSHDPTWPGSASSWLKHVPWGFRKLLVWIKNTYNNPIVFVTESGFSDTDAVGLNDEGRVRYYREYINEMLKAVTIDDCNVKSYTAWSLMDNFEWARGYTERFGIHWVNFTHPHRPRIAKSSAIVLETIFRENGFPGEEPASDNSNTIVASVSTFVFALIAFMYRNLI